MSSETRRKLQEFFAPFDKELADLVEQHQIGWGEKTGIGKVPGVFLQTGEGAQNPEAIMDAFDENVHFMMPDVEEALREEHASYA